jgi:hypothetical protein
MLSYYRESMATYVHHIPHGEFGVEARPVVREERFDKCAKIPVVRFFLALYFIAKDDAFIRPHKPDPSKPMFYRRYIWRVHNCGQRKDGTFYTSGNAAMIVFEDSKVIYDSTIDNIPFHELKSRFGTHG